MAQYAPPRPYFPNYDPLATKIANMSYWERRLFLWGQKSQPYPRFLYKYRPLEPESEKSVSHLRDIIVESRLWLSSPADFNDPFDMASHVIISGMPQEKINRLRNLFKSHGTPWKLREKHISRLMADQEEMVKIVRRAYEQQVQLVGVCSFSEKARNILMWSHYTSHHKGLALQFEIAKDTRTFLEAVSVKYDSEYPLINWIADSADELSKSILRKHCDWGYEKEHRIFRMNSAKTYLSFKPEALTGIIFGCRADDKVKSKVMELVNERIHNGHQPINIYKALQHPTRYALKVATATKGGSAN